MLKFFSLAQYVVVLYIKPFSKNRAPNRKK